MNASRRSGSSQHKRGTLRHPQDIDLPSESLACPFYKYDPIRYHRCESVHLSRIAYVLQHISRHHRLRDHQTRTRFGPEDTLVHCEWCRHEFRGLGAEKTLSGHVADCEDRGDPATIAQAGTFLPKEYTELESEVRRASDTTAKWNAIWMKCFPVTPIPSPFIERLVSQPHAQTMPQFLAAPLTINNGFTTAIPPYDIISSNPGAIFDSLPSIRSGPQATDTSTVPSTYLSKFSRYGESVVDNQAESCSSVAEPPGDSHKLDLWAVSLKTAILNVDHDKVHGILNNFFDKAAVGEYSWLLELKALGFSMDEIADELLEKSQHGPWIYSKIKLPDVEAYRHDFHIPKCLHSWKEDEAMPAIHLQTNAFEADFESPVRETIEYLCGIGGVSPMPDGSHSLQFGSVIFENANSTAIVSLVNHQSVQAVPHVWQYLANAIGTLQQVGGCCDSFTFLARQEDLVELQRIDPSRMSGLEALMSGTNSEANIEDLNPQLRDSLSAEFFSLAFALYAQGHCEPFRPFFLDTPLDRILLIGNQIWGPSFAGPCILASPVELSCFGGMTQRRVFAFQYFDSFERSKVFSDFDKRFDLKACPEELLDTWGPGDFIISKDDPENLHAISIGGGLIIPTSTENYQLPVLHWVRASKCNGTFSSTFPRNEKMVIGSRVWINQACRVTPQEKVQIAIPWLWELGTFPGYWEVSERQLGVGLQAGQSAVGILNFAQTWVKRLGQTKKSNILARRSLSISDLEGPFAVQVSFCTGIARRVRLRELLADILPAYVEDLACQPYHWGRLQGCDILEILRHEDFRALYQKLDRELQAEFETLAVAVLFLLQDTGVDRKGENFVVGCIPQSLAFHCFKIPIENESLWARILADSDDVATFAYVATRCFETELVRCRGPAGLWMNTTSLFSTAVSLCQDPLLQKEIIAQPTSWTLKDSEAYLVGRADSPLLVRVLRPNIQDEPQLRVSTSTIKASFLWRWDRKQGYKRPRRLRESRAIDHQHQMAESVVVTADFETP